MPYKAPPAQTGAAAPRRLLPAAPAAPPAEAADFLGLSVELTGFEEVELVGTGATEIYRGFLAEVFYDVLPELLATWPISRIARPPSGGRFSPTRSSARSPER